jgi:hypothetical protein
MKPKFILTIIFLIFFFHSFSTDTARVVLKNGNTFDCLMKNDDFVKKGKSKEIKSYKLTDKDSTISFSYNEISSIKINNNYYERLFPTDSKYSKKGIMTKRKVNGKIELFTWSKEKPGGAYGYSAPSPSGYGSMSFSGSSNPKVVTKYFLKKDGNTIEIKNKDFFFSVLPLIRDCKSTLEKLKNNQFTIKNVPLMILNYNQNCN